MKNVLRIVVLLFVAITLTGCSNAETADLRNFEIEIYDKAGKLVFEKKVETEETKLLDAMKEIKELKVETEKTQFGDMINSLFGHKAEGNYYWNYYINGEYASVGAADYNIKNNDKIKFQLEKF